MPVQFNAFAFAVATWLGVDFEILDPNNTGASYSNNPCCTLQAARPGVFTFRYITHYPTQWQWIVDDHYCDGGHNAPTASEPYHIDIPVTVSPWEPLVMGISDYRTSVPAGRSTNIGGRIFPSAAADFLQSLGFGNITWSLIDDGGGKGGISDNGVVTVGEEEGQIIVRATVLHGLGYNQPFVSENITISLVLIPVTNIIPGNLSTKVNIAMPLTGVVEPSDASRRTIVWELIDAGTAEGTVGGDFFYATKSGTSQILARVVDGLPLHTNRGRLGL